MAELYSEFDVASLPGPADPRQSVTGLERWFESLTAKDQGALKMARTVMSSEPGKRLADAVFGNSPFLTLTVEQEPIFFLHLLMGGVGACWAEVLADLDAIKRRAIVAEDPSIPLRLAKRRGALVIALADICELWSVDQVTEGLSQFADAALGAAVGYLLAEASRRGQLSLNDPADPEKGSGYIVLGLGKYGARELNYSSDIDLVVFFDSEMFDAAEAEALQTLFVRTTRQLVRIMSQRNEAGYVFRCDLRLRPDPNSTPVAISVIAAESYYESAGQNWERAAFIKARPVAGDLMAGERFLRDLRPFIWRRHLDFAAIQDIHSIKRQIDSHRQNRSIKLEGQNVKLGHGGIREIEFFAQTQQLVWGGRLSALRQRETLNALFALCEAGQIAPQVRDELAQSYRFLRRVEHRLQMIADEQTHRLPEDPERLAAFATFLGYANVDRLRADLLCHFNRVSAHYRELFKGAPTLALEDALGGNLVFTGSDPDPETLQTLARLGFDDPNTVDDVIRGWHRGRIRATRSARARGLLTELTPLLLQKLAQTPDPTAAFRTFDSFISALPAGVQLFSMVCARPQLLELIIGILGSAPRIADQMARQPALLEGVLTGDFFASAPSADVLEGELAALVGQASEPEEVLDVARQWTNEQRFRIGFLCLKSMLSIEESGIAWSALAEACVRVLLPSVQNDFKQRHGVVPGCDMAVIAMGKLGGREMTATSDLDLIFIYGTPNEDAVSDGERSLPASQYFARLSQKFINSLTALTAYGRLFEVDMRLRPSGRAGPIAISFEAFVRYQREQAWTWEHMALTRARVIAAPDHFREEIEAAVRGVLMMQRDPVELRNDVAGMRARIEKEHPTPSIWATKRVRGGLVDIEFIAQYLQLKHAHEHPEVLSPSTSIAITRLAESRKLPAHHAETLLETLSLFQIVQARLRLTIDGEIKALGSDDAPESVVRATDALCGLEFTALVNKMQVQAAQAHNIFNGMFE